MNPGNLTIQIADAKEEFLEKAVDLVAPVLRNGDEAPSLPEDIEELAQDAVELFGTLLRCDEQHHLLAGSWDEYPYLVSEDELAGLFRRFLTACEVLLELVGLLEERGYEVKSRSALEAVCSHAHRLVYEDETLYETEAYRVLAERALAEYQTGQVEEWPV